MKLRKFVNWIIGAPSFVWLVVFYAIPMLLVFLIAFKPVDPFGGIGEGFAYRSCKCRCCGGTTDFVYKDDTGKYFGLLKP